MDIQKILYSVNPIDIKNLIIIKTKQNGKVNRKRNTKASHYRNGYFINFNLLCRQPFKLNYMKKKTPLTWLLETYPSIKLLATEPFIESLLDLEKHQIRSAYSDGRMDQLTEKIKISSEYFNENFEQ